MYTQICLKKKIEMYIHSGTQNRAEKKGKMYTHGYDKQKEILANKKTVVYVTHYGDRDGIKIARIPGFTKE